MVDLQMMNYAWHWFTDNIVCMYESMYVCMYVCKQMIQTDMKCSRRPQSRAAKTTRTCDEVLADRTVHMLAGVRRDDRMYSFILAEYIVPH